MREIKFRAWDKVDKRWIPINVMDNWKNDLDEFPYLISEFIDTGIVNSGRQVFDCKGGKTTFLTLSGKLVDVYPYGDGSHRTFIRDISNRFILMQFTGLLDKNGKEIYEGDVVRIHFYKSSDYSGYGNCYITYKSPEYRMTGIKYEKSLSRLFGKNKCFDIKEWGLSLREEKEMEVIGNIYENPELLK